MRSLVSTWFVVLLFANPSAPAQTNETGSPESGTGDNAFLFLVDGSPALTAMDPTGESQATLEQLQTYVQAHAHRLMLFGGRNEIQLDPPADYRGSNRWTDFYFAFRKAHDIAASYPEGTNLELVLVTDGLIEPSPDDWKEEDVPEGADLEQAVGDKTVELLEEMGLPLTVILVGSQVDAELAERMVYAANGKVMGSHRVQELSELLAADGIHLSRFIYRLEPKQNLEQVSSIIGSIPRPVSTRLSQSLVVGLVLAVVALVGVGVRAFPAPGDREVLEMWTDLPYHIAIDRWRRLPTGVPAWSRRGCSLIESPKQAAATFTPIGGKKKFAPDGFNLERLGPIGRELVRLPIPALHERLEELKKSADEKQALFATQLDDRGRLINPDHAKKLLTTPPLKRRKLDGGDFLMAKVHLLHNQTLYTLLSEPQVKCNVYGTAGESQVLGRGSTLSLGPYSFSVDDVTPGSRKDVRVTLTYKEAPSPLWLKMVIPSFVQKLLRLRRSQERLVA